ncbi:hypothetical protein ACFP3I_08385 [Chryseobacterium arachidis]|uniref:hypothetical protein n=1 Tax=Chryseobacterium arachidis TaxID=1416778 RepID=UPI0036097034
MVLQRSVTEVAVLLQLLSKTCNNYFINKIQNPEVFKLSDFFIRAYLNLKFYDSIIFKRKVLILLTYYFRKQRQIEFAARSLKTQLHQINLLILLCPPK